MPAAAFKPKGDRAEWEPVYDELRAADVGEVVTYERLTDVLGRDFLADRGPIYRATTALEESNKRTVVNVPKVGYRIATAEEHEPLARGHHKRSRRQLRSAIRKIASADRTQLDPAARQRFDALELNMGRQADMLRRLSERVDRVEKVTARYEVSTGEMSDRLEKLEEMLRKHGIAS